MSESATASPSLFDRLQDGSLLQRYWVGAIIAVVLYALTQIVDIGALGWHLWLWGPGEAEAFWEDGSTQMLAFLCLLIGNAISFGARERSAALGDFDDLQSGLNVSGTSVRAARALLEEGVSRIGITLRAAPIFFAAMLLTALAPRAGGPPFVHDVLTHVLIIGMAFWLGAARILEQQQHDRAFDALLGQVRSIDLLDLDKLEPFGRRGLRRAVALAVLVGLTIPVLVVASRELHTSWMSVLLVGPWTLALVSFLRPVLRVRTRIRTEKQVTLARIREGIRQRQPSLGGADSTPTAGSGLADWIAYHDFVDSVREWPFDVSTILRFMLVLAIPLGSWLGSALVERLLDAVLD